MSENCIVRIIGEFSNFKQKTAEIADLMESSALLSSRAYKLRSCGTSIGLRADDDGGYSVTAANFCRQRLCPMCQRRRSLRTYAAMSRIYDIADRDGYRFLHVVLTVPNCSGDRLNETINFLYARSALLFRRSGDIHTRAACNAVPGMKAIRDKISRSFCGVFRVLEVSHNEKLPVDHPLAFHPHLHCLVAVRKSYFTGRDYVKYDDLRAVWAALTGVENVQIFMGKVTDRCAGIAEVAKYAVKPFKGKMSVDVLEALHGALFNRRLVQNFGIFRDWFRAIGIDPDSVLDEEPAGVADVWLTYEGEGYSIEGL